MNAVRTLAALALALLAAVAPAQQRGPDGLLTVPPLARITDAANVLSAADKRALDDKLAAFETAHGTQMAIVLVPSVKPEPIEDYANRIGKTWKIGRANVGDGLLIVAAIEDRRVRIEVFRALEGAIPDAVARRIIREQIAPRFKSGDYAGGLNAALDAIFKQVEGGGLPAVVAKPRGNEVFDNEWLALLMPFLIGGVIVGSILRKLFGVPGAAVAGGGTGVAAYSLLQSAVLGGLAGVIVFVIAAMFGSSAGRAVAGRRRGGGAVVIPGGWNGGGSWGGGGFGGGGSFGGGGGGFGGGMSSGGGGDAAGGGASGDW
jgi:uncharacterized protein